MINKWIPFKVLYPAFKNLWDKKRTIVKLIAAFLPAFIVAIGMIVYGIFLLFETRYLVGVVISLIGLFLKYYTSILFYIMLIDIYTSERKKLRTYLQSNVHYFLPVGIGFSLFLFGFCVIMFPFVWKFFHNSGINFITLLFETFFFYIITYLILLRFAFFPQGIIIKKLGLWKSIVYSYKISGPYYWTFFLALQVIAILLKLFLQIINYIILAVAYLFTIFLGKSDIQNSILPVDNNNIAFFIAFFTVSVMIVTPFFASYLTLLYKEIERDINGKI